MKNKTKEQENLALMQNTSRYHRWIYNNIKGFLSREILEVGGGLGSMTKFLVGHSRNVTSTDIDKKYVNDLNKRFKYFKDFKAIQKDISITTRDFGKFNTCLFINVLEHIADDEQALENAYKLLDTGGSVVLVCPAHKWLFGPVDKVDGHYRRYSKKELKEKLESSGFKVKKLKYMNFPGMVGWFYHNKILKLEVHKAGDLKLFNKLTPLFEFVEKFIPIIGLSIIAVGEKQ